MPSYSSTLRTTNIDGYVPVYNKKAKTITVTTANSEQLPAIAKTSMSDTDTIDSFGFTLTKNGTEITPKSFAISDKGNKSEIVFTLPDVSNGSNNTGEYVITYDRTKDINENGISRTAIVTEALLKNGTTSGKLIVDEDAPTITNASYEDTEQGLPKITLTASEELMQITKGADKGFSILFGGNEIVNSKDLTVETVADSNGKNTKIVLTSNKVLTKSGYYDILYNGTDVKDKATNSMEEIKGGLEFEIEETKGLIATTNKDGTKIIINLPEGFKNSVPYANKKDFRISSILEVNNNGSINSFTRTPNGVKFENNTIELELGENLGNKIEYNHEVRVVYIPEEAAIANLETVINNGKAPLRMTYVNKYGYPGSNVENNVVNPSEITTDNGYTVIKNENNKACLVGYKKPPTTGISKPTGIILKNGEFIEGNNTYTITAIGGIATNKTDLKTITDKELQEHIKKVTEIKSNALSGNKTITNLFFPKVEEIGYKAFSYAENIEKFKFPIGVYLGTEAFEYIGSLKEIHLGTDIGNLKVKFEKRAFDNAFSSKTRSNNGVKFFTNKASLDDAKKALEESKISNISVEEGMPTPTPNHKPNQGGGSYSSYFEQF